MIDYIQGTAKLGWRSLLLTVRRYGRHRSADAAAGMTYYAMFALFPLLLFLVTVGSLVLKSEQAQDQIVRLVTAVLPVSNELVVSILGQVLSARGTVSAVAAVSLAWSSSGFMAILTRQINRIWPMTVRRHVVRVRLLGFGLLGGMATLLLLWLGITTSIWPMVRHFVEQGILADMLLGHGIWVLIASWVTPLIIFFAVYYVAPNTHVIWWGAFIPAMLATLIWKLATQLLVWYLRSGWAGYHLVYGSLSGAMVLMLWLYVSAVVLLFGAHLSAVICRKETILRQLA